MIKFFVLIALIFVGVYYSLTRESLPAIVEQKISSKAKVKTVVEMANYLSTIEKKEIAANPEIIVEEIAVIDYDDRLPEDPESTLPPEYTLPEDLAARLPSSDGEEENEDPYK